MNTVFIENDFLNIKIPKNYIENKYIQKIIDLLYIEDKINKSELTENDAWELSEEIKENWWKNNKDSFLKGIEWKLAYNLCKTVDLKDTPFVALAIELNAMLWTGDKKLIEGLSKLDFQNFYKLEINEDIQFH